MKYNVWFYIEKISHAILKLLFKLIGKDLTDAIVESFMQFVKFGIVGLSNTIISYFIYVLMLLLFHTFRLFPRIDFILSSIVAFVLSVLWSFYWNSRVVFALKDGEERSVFKALIKTFISYSFTGLFLSNALLVLWVKVIHISEFIAPIINLLATVPLNFIINKLWAFKKK